MLKGKAAEYLKSGEKEKQFPSTQDADLQKRSQYFVSLVRSDFLSWYAWQRATSLYPTSVAGDQN